MYADDTNILIVDKEEEALQHKITLVMQQLELWFWKNDVTVNIDKTCAVSLRSHQNRYPSRPRGIIFNTNGIAYSSELKFLPLFIMENSAWHVHIHSLCASLSKIYSMIKALRNVASTHTIWSIYFAYFQSKVKVWNYVLGWRGEICNDISATEKADSNIIGVHECESCRHIFRKLQILTLA